MTCPKCNNIVERPDIPHVVRACEGCGRLLRIHEPGEHGIGCKIRKGDQVVIPADWLKLSLNPLKSSGQLSRYGLQWFAEQIHLEDLPKKKDDIGAEIDRLEKRTEEILNSSKLLEGLDLANPDHADKIINSLKERRDSVEWWTFLSGMFLSFLRDAIEKNDIHQAVWAMGCAERSRSMLVFKEHLEEVVWMGQSAKRVIDILRTWDSNQSNDDEGFWQITFMENVYAISQVFAVPLVFIKESAYVGGMNIEWSLKPQGALSGRRSPPWLPLGCPWRWSIPARPVMLPRPRGHGPKRMRSTRGPWPIAPQRSGRRPGPGQMRRRRNSAPCSRGNGNSSPCGLPNSTVLGVPPAAPDR